MRTTWTLGLLLTVFAGCIDPQPEPSALTQPADASEIRDGDPSGAAVLRHGLLGPDTTTSNATRYFVESAGPVSVTLRTTQRILASEVVEGNRTWTIVLEPGRNAFDVSIEGEGVAWFETVEVTRLVRTSLTIDYCVYHPDSPGTQKAGTYDFWVDLASRPSLPLYEAANATHIDAFTAHDQLALFEAETGVPVVATWYESFQSFSVDRIDEAGNAVSNQAPPYWLFSVNGEDAGVGMSLYKLGADDDVRWRLSNLGPPCA